MSCHISATILGIARTERWLGDGSASYVARFNATGFCFLWGYVENIIYQVKVNDLQYLKARIRDAVATVTPNMLQETWYEVAYRVNICRAT
jgi:hypothetical protein